MGFDTTLWLLKHHMPTDTFFYIFRYIWAGSRFGCGIALQFGEGHMPLGTFFYIVEYNFK